MKQPDKTKRIVALVKTDPYPYRFLTLKVINGYWRDSSGFPYKNDEILDWQYITIEEPKEKSELRKLLEASRYAKDVFDERRNTYELLEMIVNKLERKDEPLIDPEDSNYGKRL